MRAAYVLDRLTGLEGLLAAMQEQETLHVITAAQTAGFGADLDFFIGVDAQVRQHEFGPVLIQVAEEHQAQAVTQVHHREAVQRVGQRGAPLAKLRLSGNCAARPASHSTCWPWAGRSTV